MKPLLFAFPGNETLALLIGAETGQLVLHTFPDGESYVRFDSPVAGRQVILLCTLDRPDAKFLPLLFAAKTARELGATSVGLVAPYLAYMRQDSQFRPGEGVTSRYFAEVTSSFFDWLVTVDPHLHRISSLGQIYSIPSRVAQAAPFISQWVKQLSTPLLIGPDGESAQWVAAVAREAGVPHVVAHKTRHGDRDVDVSIPDIHRYRSATPVLIDDIISTAHTMIETIRHLKRAGMAPPVCVGVHAVFAGNAHQDLLAAGAARVITCNTIAHDSNGIDVSTAIVAAVNELLSATCPLS